MLGDPNKFPRKRVYFFVNFKSLTNFTNVYMKSFETPCTHLNKNEEKIKYKTFYKNNN